MQPSAFYFNTVNEYKILEIKEIFADTKVAPKFLTRPVVEVLSNDLKTVIMSKALEAYKQCRVPVIIEHGGLLIKHLKDFPGALSKPMWDIMGKDICELIPESISREAIAISGVCYCDGTKRVAFIGETNGSIAKKSLGTNGFQWDPIFIPEGQTKTYGEMSQSEKLTFSQAAKAYNQLKTYLQI